MNVQRSVGGQTDDDLVVLQNRQDRRLRGDLSVMNREIENAIFGKSLSDARDEQCRGQESTP